MHYVKFNSKGFDSEIDKEATRVSIPEQLEMLHFICSDLPLARMPDTMAGHISQKWYEFTTGDQEIDPYG